MCSNLFPTEFNETADKFERGYLQEDGEDFRRGQNFRLHQERMRKPKLRHRYSREEKYSTSLSTDRFRLQSDLPPAIRYHSPLGPVHLLAERIINFHNQLILIAWLNSAEPCQKIINYSANTLWLAYKF